jgi:hypothetical protein
MKNIFLGFSLITTLLAFSQKASPKQIADNCYKFLSSQNYVRVENHASMDRDLDSINITENFHSVTKISNHQKVYINWTNGEKRKLLNFDGEMLSLVSVDDGFYSEWDLKGDILALERFAKDTLDYEFPLISLFKKDGGKEINKLNPESIYLGIKVFKGKQVHHLVFRVKEFSWQMFVSADENRPVPYKIIINDHIGKTQYTAELSNWDFSELRAKEFEITMGDFRKINHSK